MISLLWANQIIMNNKKYSDVPRLLRDKVKEILISLGHEDMTTE